MNRAHAVICSSGWWERTAEHELLPWGLRGVELGDDVLEIGPGFGATTRVLTRLPGRLTVVELDSRYCQRLRAQLGEEVAVVEADATKMPFGSDRFSSVVCFTMLHHLPSAERQDELLAEATRVLRPGGVLAGTDSVGTGMLFRALHVGDTLVPVDPDHLRARLESAGLIDTQVERGGRSFRFNARKPAHALS